MDREEALVEMISLLNYDPFSKVPETAAHDLVELCVKLIQENAELKDKLEDSNNAAWYEATTR